MLRLLNRFKIDIRWSDMDAYRHVNHCRYFEYMSEARSAFFKELTLDDNCQIILVDAQCNFKKPYYFPATAIITQSVSEIGNTSFTLHYHFTEEKHLQQTYAEGWCKMVCFNAMTQRPVRIPKTILELLNSSN